MVLTVRSHRINDVESCCSLPSPCALENCVLVQSLWRARQTPSSGDLWASGPLMQQTRRLEAMSPL